MLQDMHTQMKIHWSHDSNKRHSHLLHAEHPEYFEQLRKFANVEGLPEILSSIYFDNMETRTREPFTYRKYYYTIIDNKRFNKTKYLD